MVSSGQAESTEEEHRLVSAVVTAADEPVLLLPGANAEVAVVRALRHPATVLSELSPFRNVVHPELIPVGIRGFAVAEAVGVVVPVPVPAVLACFVSAT